MSRDDRSAESGASRDARADDRYGDWDAAYVLGSLSPAERHEYEQHLAVCPACRLALADLAGMPGLLGSVSPVDGLSMVEPSGSPGALPHSAPDSAPDGSTDSPPNLLPALIARASRVRRRRRALVSFGALGAVAAAVALTVVVVLPPTLGSGPAASTLPGSTMASQVTFTSEVGGPLSAVATLDDEPWGTRIDWKCSYDGVIDSTYARGYAMLVTDRTGTSTQVATWTSSPGTTATPTATTSIHRADIASVSIVSTDSGSVLLRSVL